jgi:hypothetical protein
MIVSFPTRLSIIYTMQIGVESLGVPYIMSWFVVVGLILIHEFIFLYCNEN